HRPRAARGSHAAERRIGSRVDRKEEAGAVQLAIELLARDSGLHAAIQVLAIYLQDAIHLAEVDADPAAHRGNVALERGADAIRDDRSPARGTQPYDFGDLFCGMREHDGVRRKRRVIGLVLAVPIADRSGCGHTIAETRCEIGHQTIDHVLSLHASSSPRIPARWSFRTLPFLGQTHALWRPVCHVTLSPSSSDHRKTSHAPITS